MIHIRDASDGDLKSILSIYSYYVRETAISFDLEIPDIDDLKREMHDIRSRYPYFVAEYDGTVIGFAYAHRFREKSGFNWDVELTVYLSHNRRGEGIGTLLYGKLIEALKPLGYRNAYVSITGDNEQSLIMHEKFGFRKVCTLGNTAYKMGRWHDLVIMSKQLCPYDDVPSAPIPYRTR